MTRLEDIANRPQIEDHYAISFPAGTLHLTERLMQLASNYEMLQGQPDATDNTFIELVNEEFIPGRPTGTKIMRLVGPRDGEPKHRQVWEYIACQLRDEAVYIANPLLRVQGDDYGPKAGHRGLGSIAERAGWWEGEFAIVDLYSDKAVVFDFDDSWKEIAGLLGEDHEIVRSHRGAYVDPMYPTAN